MPFLSSDTLNDPVTAKIFGFREFLFGKFIRFLNTPKTGNFIIQSSADTVKWFGIGTRIV